MKKSNTLLLIAAALVIVAGVLGAYIFWQEKARSKEDQRIAEEINPYYKRLDEITSELSQLERDNTLELNYTGVVNFLFETPSSRIDEEALAQLEDAGYKGIITISENSLPDRWGYLSSARMKELCDSGWTIAVSLEQPGYLNWDGAPQRTPEELISSLTTRLESANLPKPEAIYLTEELTDEIKAAAKDAGIHAIISSNKKTEVKGMKDYLPVTGIDLDGSDDQFSDGEEEKNVSAVVYVIGFEEGTRQYSAESVKKVTDRLSESIKSGKLQTMSLEKAYQYYEKTISDYEKEEAEYEEKVRALKEEEKEIEDKIAAFRDNSAG